MSDYNVTLTLDRPATADLADALADALAAYHPAVGNDDHHLGEVIMTLPAASVTQAATTALLVASPIVDQLGATLTASAVRTTDDHDRRILDEPIPELLSVPQAAEALGVTRQAVLKRIKSGQLRHRHVGERILVTTRSDIDRLKASTTTN